MSKSKGNVVNPDDMVRQFGADALRLYEMFIGPFNQHVSWDPHGIVGTRRFLERVWKLFHGTWNREQGTKKQSAGIERLLHQTVKKVSEDIENLRMNTAVSSLMISLNQMDVREGEVGISHIKIFLKLLAPFAPHIAEELWKMLGEKKSIHAQPWPRFSSKIAEEEFFPLVIQVNGKVRAAMEVVVGISKEEAERLALSRERVIKALDGKKPVRIIYVPGKLINFVF